MLVRFLTDVASPFGTYAEGEVAEVSNVVAGEWCACGHCAPVKESPEATVVTPPETAVIPKPRSRKAKP